MNIVEIDCLEAQARERTVKRAHQAARRGSARKGKEFRCYHRAGGTGAQAVTHDALREIDLSRVDHARAGIMNGPVCFQHGPTIGTPPLVRVMTLAFQGYAIATTAASSSAATSVSGRRQGQESCAGKPDQARGVNGNAEQTE